MIALWVCVAMAAPTPLTVDQAVERALAQAGDYQMAQIDEEIAGGEVKNARAALLPAVGVDGSVVYNSPSPGVPGVQSFTSADGVGWVRATVGASGTVFGGASQRVKADQALVAAAHAGTEVTRRALAQATIDAYFALALAEAQHGTATENAKVADAFARAMALRLDAEEVPEIDVVRARLMAAQRQDELFQAEAGVSAASAELRVLIGPGEWAVAALDDTAIDGTEVDGLVAAIDDGDPAHVSPDVQAATAEADAARAMIGATRAEFLPQLDYAVGYGFDSDTLGTDLSKHLGLIAGVNVRAPLFDWGIGARSVASARLAADQADITRAHAERTAQSDRDVAVGQARTAAERVKVLADSLPDAERNVTISLARYTDGEGDLIEVSDAEQTLIDLRYARTGAVADYQTALAHLRLLAGR